MKFYTIENNIKSFVVGVNDDKDAEFVVEACNNYNQLQNRVKELGDILFLCKTYMEKEYGKQKTPYL